MTKQTPSHQANHNDETTKALDDAKKVDAVFSYIQELNRAKNKPQANIKKYKGLKEIYWADLNGSEKAFSSPTNNDQEDAWLRVDRPQIENHPIPSPALRAWIKSSARLADWTNVPEINEVLTIEEDAESTEQVDPADSLNFCDFPEVEKEWDEYQDAWQEWAIERHRVHPIAKAYADLFAIAQQLEQSSEDYEAFLGIGFLAWLKYSDKPFNHPLVLSPVSVKLVPNSQGQIIVEPADFSSGMQLSDDFLGELRPGSDITSNTKKVLDEIGDPFGEGIHECLRDWVMTLDEEAKYETDMNVPFLKHEHPVVHYAPLVFLRKRQHNGYVKAFDDLLKAVEDGEALPGSIIDLVNVTDGTVGEEIDWDGETTLAELGDDAPPLFALPANAQQLRIVEELKKQRGVVVQGPPGTGKTHTIANLITHSVAHGKRVLVTSHTAQALHVLKEKLPEEIKNLSVSVLGKGKDGAEDLKNSVQVLLERRDSPEFGEDQMERRLADTTNEIKTVTEQISEIKTEIAAVRLERFGQLEFAPGYVGTVGEVAEQIADRHSQYSWLEDNAVGDAPINAQQIASIQTLMTKGANDPDLLLCSVPLLQGIPTPDEFASAVCKVEELSPFQSQAEIPEDVWSAVNNLSDEDSTTLTAAISNYQVAIATARNMGNTWMPEALVDMLRGQANEWEVIQKRSEDFLQEYPGGTRNMFEGNDIEETQLRRLHRQASDLHKHLSAGNGRGNSFFKPAPVKAAKALIDLLAELGEGASTTADISEAKNSLNQLLAIRECEKEWGSDRISPESATLSKRRAQVENALLQLSQVREIVSESKKIKQLFSGSLHSLFGSETEIQKLRNCLEVRDHNKNLGQAEQTLVSVIKNLDLQICDLEVHSSIKRLAEAARVRDIREYETAHRLVSNTLVQITDAATYDGLIQTLTLHAPKFAISLTEGSVSDDQINNFDAAWNWSRAQSFLDQYRKYGKENTFKEQLSKLHEQKRELIGEFAGQLAWRHALKNVNPAQAQSLMGYQLALKKIGAGTGKNASKYRNDARKELDRCEGAVPVWIMPTYRVAELMKMEAEKFDVVIIDEASQSSLDALFLLWLGKQIVVVGDDEQISPMNMSGKIVGQLQSLQKKHLMEIEADHIFDPKSSLFDIAKIKLGVSICLVEHFRCMPEIIEFSNRNFYVPRNKSLQPLRQFGTDRLVPLMHKFVPGELSEIGKFNELEGREIVDQIIACHSDPAYDGKTFGVINLHSSSKQHEWIRNQLLHSSFGAEGIEERQLQFGTPNQFQGAERDVIFLSMVVSQHPEGRKLRRYGSNTGEAQRLNVAASRAKDQMWLFHSVTLADLSPKCLRAAFISHFNEPPVLDVQPFTAPVDRHYPQKPFRSLFEQRVFLDIRERGYVVQPAYKAGGYEIDMVVAGEGGRLAIECDGSHWHNAETKDHDDFREENLKRVGWKFFRLPDFDYYANQTKSLEPLWEQLAEEGIYPTGHVPDTASPSLPYARCVEAEAVVSNINQINKDLVHLTERQAPRACNQAMPAEV